MESNESGYFFYELNELHRLDGLRMGQGSWD